MSIWSQIKETTIGYWEVFLLSIPKIAIGLLIIGFFMFLGAMVARILKRRVNATYVDTITINFVIRIVRLIMVTMGLILGLHAMGFEGLAGGLLASAGVGAVILGFAFKEIGENFLAGIILVFDRPFDIGDTVSINGNMGTVVRLQFRTTQIKSHDGKDIFVPNGAVIRNDLFNFTRDGFLRLDFIIGVDYDDDLDKAKELIINKINSFPEVLRNEQTQVVVNDFGTNSVNLKVLFWVDTMDYKVAVSEFRTNVMIGVKNLLMEHQFGLPANIQEIKMYRPDPIPVTIKKEQ